MEFLGIKKSKNRGLFAGADMAHKKVVWRGGAMGHLVSTCIVPWRGIIVLKTWFLSFIALNGPII